MSAEKRGIIHMKAQYTTLIVNEMEESVSFYRDILHFPVVSEHPLGNGV